MRCFALENWRKSPGRDFAGSREKAPAAPRQVHPTASSLSSHRVLPVQLYAGPQLFSTVSETKTARHPCAASLWKTGGNRQGATLLVRGKKAPAAPRQVHPTASSLGSHRVLPVQLYAGPQLLSTVSETKTERHPCSAPLRIGKLAASARARLQVGFVTAVVTNEEGRRNVVGGLHSHPAVSYSGCGAPVGA